MKDKYYNRVVRQANFICEEFLPSEQDRELQNLYESARDFLSEDELINIFGADNVERYESDIDYTEDLIGYYEQLGYLEDDF